MGPVATYKNTAGAFEQWVTIEGVVSKDYYQNYRLTWEGGDCHLDKEFAEAVGGVGARVRYTTHRTVKKL